MNKKLINLKKAPQISIDEINETGHHSLIDIPIRQVELDLADLTLLPPVDKFEFDQSEFFEAHLAFKNLA